MNEDKELQAIKLNNEDNQQTSLEIEDENQYIINEYGNHRVYWFNEQGEPRITIGPHWYLSVVTVCMIIGFGYVLSNMVLQLKGQAPLAKFGCVFIVLMTLVLFLLTALKNEGIATSNNQVPIEQQEKICEVCKIRTDSSTYHCTDCNACIKGLDHHCIWSGKCIGKGNVKEFYGFLICTFGFFIYVSLIIFLK